MPPRWTLALGPDELPSAALLAALPALVADPSAAGFVFPRLWVSVDGAGWHDEAPWNLDRAACLIRDAPVDGAGEQATRPVERPEPIFDLRLTGATAVQRRRGIIEREIVAMGGPGSLREARVRMQEPERFARQAPATLDHADQRRIASAMDARSGGAAERAGRAFRSDPAWIPDGGLLAGGAVRVVRSDRAAGPTLPAGIDDPDPDPSWPTAREGRPGTPGSRSPIPRVIHRVWLGGASLPEVYRAYGETWAAHHPEWEVRLWTDADAPRPAGLDRARNLAERADLTRYEIMRRHGGVYVDTDVECLRPIDELIAGVHAFAAYEVPGRCCNAVLGAVPGHPAFEELVGLAATVAGHGRFPEAMGTTFPTFVLEAHPDVTLFAPHRFYPDLWDGTLNAGAEPPYAHHHWAASWSDD